MSEITGAARQELASRWYVILGALVGAAISSTCVIPYTQGVMLSAMEADGTGWTRGSLSFAFSCYGALAAFSAPFVGALADRFGVRLMIPFSLLFTAAAVYMLSLTPDYRFLLVVLIALGIFGSGSSMLTISRVLAGAFDKARGTALGIGLVGVGVMSVFAPPVLSVIATEHGWRAAYRELATVVLLGTPIVAVLLWKVGAAQPRNPVAAHTNAPPAQAPYYRRSVFWKMLLAFLLLQLAAAGAMFHFVPMQVDRGIPLAEAAWMGSFVGIALIVSRVAAGFICDRYFAPYVGAGISLIAACGLLMLLSGLPGAAIGGAMALGATAGAEFDLGAYLTARYFPQHQFGKTYGVLWAAMAVGALVSGSAYGFVLDLTGSYTSILLASVVTLAASAILFLTLPRFPDTEGEPAADGIPAAA